MASVYPGGLDTLNTSHADSVGEIIHAADVNNVADAVNKIETELGTLPKGIFSNVAARIGNINSRLDSLYYGSVTTSQRDAITAGNRPNGLTVFNVITNQYEYNSGSDATPVWQAVGYAGNFAYASYTPTLSSAGGTAPTLGNGTLTGQYMQLGKMVQGIVKLSFGSTSTYGTGNFMLSFPVPPADVAQNAPVGYGNAYDLSSLTTSYVFQAMLWSSAGFRLVAPPSTPMNATSPITFATGDVIAVTLLYQAA